MPDLLSTATALFALRVAGGKIPAGEIRQTQEFVVAHWNEDGGFCGTPADPLSDTEYTFYALLALGCLQAS